MTSSVSPLLGTPAHPLGPLSAALSEDVEAMETMRHHLLSDWKLLQTMGQTNICYNTDVAIPGSLYVFVLSTVCENQSGADDWHKMTQMFSNFN